MCDRPTLRRITPKDLLDVFRRSYRSVFLAAALVVAVFFMLRQVIYVPRYEATATLYLLRQPGEGHAPEEFSLSLSVVNDCTYMLKSHAVLDQAAEELALTQSYHALKQQITVVNPSGTRVLEVTVEAETPQQAKAIADCVCRIGAEKIEHAMGSSLVNLYEAGIAGETPSNRLSPLLYAGLGAAAAVLRYCAALLFFFLKGARTACVSANFHDQGAEK